MKRFRCAMFLFVMFFLGLMAAGRAGATTYQEEVNIRFTFDQTLSVDLSSTSLAISSLAPGTAGTSSPIDVTVNTNNIGGYTLTASVGDASHNTTSLTRADGSGAVFTNIARDANLTALSTDNTWGYSVDAGAHFFGLPLYSDAESLILKETDGAVEDNTVSFLIGAKAGVSQPLGDYSNVVNFKVVAKVYEPLRTFQDIEYSEYATLLPQVGDTMDIQDSRDGEIYTIGRLADGNVWLLDNLALDLTNSTVKANLSSTNTNASNTTLNYLKNGGGTTSDQYATAGVANWTSSYSYSAPLIATSGTGNLDDWTKDTLQSYGSGSGKIGVYYNYCAASAGSYCYGGGTSAGTSSGNATEDICPKGWRMPTGGSSGEYQALYTAYSSNATNFKNALRTPLSGYFLDGSANYQGSDGYFWLSTYYNSNSMYRLYVNSSIVYPQDGNDRYFGFSVRCVLDVPVSTPTTLQEATDAQLAAMLPNIGDTIELDDERDCNTYHVRKLSDGNYWMIDDLRYGDGGHCEGEGYGTDGFDLWEDDGNSWYETGERYRSMFYSANYLGDDIYDDNGDPIDSKQGLSYNYCAASKGTWCVDSEEIAMSLSSGGGGDVGGGGEECWDDPSMCGGEGMGYGYDESFYIQYTIDSYGTELSEDICPSGWKIPSLEEYTDYFNAASASVGSFIPESNIWMDGSHWTSNMTFYDIYFNPYTDDGEAYKQRSEYAFIRCIKSSF